MPSQKGLLILPNRDLKESNRRSPSLQLLSDAAERLWYRLITAVDDFGRMEADPQVVFATCFQRVPKGWTVKKVHVALLELSAKFLVGDQPLIHFYEIGNRPYLQITSAICHIRRRAEHSKYPSPPDGAFEPNVCKPAIVGPRCQPLSSAGIRSDLRSSISDLRSPKKTPYSPPAGGVWQEAEIILAFLNERTGKHFQARHPNGDPTKALQLVQVLIEKGYTELNLRQVVANRCLKWRNDPKMAEFLRPETLFRASNFESYFGELGKGVTHDTMSGVS